MDVVSERAKPNQKSSLLSELGSDPELVLLEVLFVILLEVLLFVLLEVLFDELPEGFSEGLEFDPSFSTLETLRRFAPRLLSFKTSAFLSINCSVLSLNLCCINTNVGKRIEKTVFQTKRNRKTFFCHIQIQFPKH